MAEIILLRHGQAAFGGADYDRLSDLGAQQCQAVAGHWLALGARWTSIRRGGLARHRDSLAAVASCYARAGVDLPETVIDSRLDEHPGVELMRLHGADREACAQTDPEARRVAFFRHFAGLMQSWMCDELDCHGHRSWSEFRDHVTEAIEEARQTAQDPDRVLLVTSGGVAALAACLALGQPAEQFLRLALHLGNAARVHLHAGRRGLELTAFNDTAGLDAPQLHTLV